MQNRCENAHLDVSFVILRADAPSTSRAILITIPEGHIAVARSVLALPLFLALTSLAVIDALSPVVPLALSGATVSPGATLGAMNRGVTAAILSLAFTRCTSTLSLIRVGLRGPGEVPRVLTLMARRSRLVVRVISVSRLVTAPAVAVLLLILTLTLFVTLFLLLLETPDVLVKCCAAKVFRVKSAELFSPLYAGPDFLIRITDLNSRLQVPDYRSQSIDLAALVALLLVAVVLETSDNLLAELDQLILVCCKRSRENHLFEENGNGILVILSST
jgi:hypothetical protein